jgi:hypothetical protein
LRASASARQRCSWRTGFAGAATSAIGGAIDALALALPELAGGVAIRALAVEVDAIVVAEAVTASSACAASDVAIGAKTIAHATVRSEWGRRFRIGRRRRAYHAADRASAGSHAFIEVVRPRIVAPIASSTEWTPPTWTVSLESKPEIVTEQAHR